MKSFEHTWLIKYLELYRSKSIYLSIGTKYLSYLLKIIQMYELSKYLSNAKFLKTLNTLII